MEDPGDVLVAGEHEHLPTCGLLRDELHEHAGRRAGPRVVEVHQRVVHHDRQAHVVSAEVADQRQPQRQKHLLPCAAAEPFGIPDGSVGIVHLQAGLVDRRRDRRIAALGEPGEPAGRLPEHGGLMIPGDGGAGLFEQHPRPLQHPPAIDLLGEPLLHFGEVGLQALRAAVVGGRLDLGHDGLPPVNGRGEGRPLPPRGRRRVGEPAGERHDVSIGQPAIDVRRFGRAAAGIPPGRLGHLGIEFGLLVLRPTIDLGEELRLGRHLPAGVKLAHTAVGDEHLPLHMAMLAAGEVEPPRELRPTTDDRLVGVEPFLQQPQMVERRRLGHELALDEQFVHPAAERGHLLPLVPCLFRQPPAVVIECEERVPMLRDLPHLAR